jgi:purine-binding chemotaxis protein CheW
MAIDWQKIHDRLETIQRSIEREESLSAAEIGKILKVRARALAVETVNRFEKEFIRILEFRIANENYALELSYIIEVCPLQDLTALPGTPSYVSGIINVHGRIYSVIDLKKFFELPDKGLSNLNKVIIVQHDGMDFGILADAVTGVKTVSPATLQPLLPTLTGIRLEYLKGIAADQLIVLDAVKLLTDANLLVKEK